MPKVNPKSKPLRDKAKAWREKHPEWEDSESVKLVYSLLSTDSSRYSYRTKLPYFFAFIDETPDEVIEKRKKHVEENPPNRFYENEAQRYKNYLVSLDYSGKTISTYTGVVAGFYSNYHPAFALNMPDSFWEITESKERAAKRKRKEPPDNAEIRAIYGVADRKTRIALLFGYQCGLAPVDCVKLTWSNLNIDFDKETRKFIPLEHYRSKTGEKGEIIINPDLFHVLKGEWTAQGKPTQGYILHYRGEELAPRHPNLWLKEASILALGEKRGNEIRFKDLRDSFNNVIKNHEGLKQEIADRLMGHSIGAKSAYVTGQAVSNAYRGLFPKLSVNSWLHKTKAEGYDQLSEEIDLLRDALKQVESENRDYKTRVDGLQDTIGEVERLRVQIDSRDQQIQILTRDMAALRAKVEELRPAGEQLEVLERVLSNPETGPEIIRLLRSLDQKTG